MENEIRVGEYIRTKDGIIDKIVDIRDTYSERKLIAFEKSNSLKSDIGLKAMVVKYSPNLIDVIEEGDYVNGKKVYSIGTICSTIGILTTINLTDGTFITNDMQILDVITKEQFESVSYKVKE